MKSFVISFVVCVLMVLCGKSNAQSIGLRLGHSFMPADHVSLRYEHWTNGSINFSLGGFYECSRKNNLDLSAYGAELLGEYASCREGFENGVFGYRLGLGGGWQLENEPWIYKDWPLSKRSSFGVLGELTGEWFMTESFTLRACAQQKYLFNSLIGRYRFLIGIGIAFRLNTF